MHSPNGKRCRHGVVEGETNNAEAEASWLRAWVVGCWGIASSPMLAGPALALASGSSTLVVANPADPQHFDPGIATVWHTHAVADSLFNGLVSLFSTKDGGAQFNSADRKWHFLD